MRHDEAERLIAGLALGELDAEERAAVEAHVAECEACRQALAEMRATYSLLEEAVAALPREALDAGQVQAVLAAARVPAAPAVPEVPAMETVLPRASAPAGSNRAGPLPRRRRRLLWVAAGVAACVVMVLLGLSLQFTGLSERLASGVAGGPRPAFLASAPAASASHAPPPSSGSAGTGGLERWGRALAGKTAGPAAAPVDPNVVHVQNRPQAPAAGDEVRSRGDTVWFGRGEAAGGSGASGLTGGGLGGGTGRASDRDHDRIPDGMLTEGDRGAAGSGPGGMPGITMGGGTMGPGAMGPAAGGAVAGSPGPGMAAYGMPGAGMAPGGMMPGAGGGGGAGDMRGPGGGAGAGAMPGGGSGVITPDVAFGFRDGKAKAGEKPAAEVPPKAGGEWLFRAAGRRRAAEPATRESQPGPGGMGAAAHEVASLTGRAAKPRSPQATRAGADDGADLSRQSPEAAEEAFGRQVAKGAEPDEMKRDFRRAVAERTAPVVAELSQKLAEAESAPARPAAPAAGPVAGQSGEQAAPAKAPAVVRAEPATAPAARADVTEAKPAEAATTRFGAVALGDNLQAGAEVTRFDVAGEGKQQAESLTAEIAPAAPAPAAATPPVPADKKAEPVVVAVVDTGVEGTHVNFSLGVANGVAQQVDTRKLDLGLQVPPTAAPEPAAKSAPGDVTVDYAAATAPDRDGDPLATDEKEVAAIDHARSEEALGDRSAIGQSLGKKLADTAKAIADLPVQGRLFGRKEAARTDAEDTADKTELGESLDLYYAAGQKAWDTDSDQVALGVDFRLTYPAAAKALEEERGKAGLEPEGAVRLLVERAEDLAPAEQERLAETLRQSQLASLAEERPLSEEELTAPPPPPPGPVNPFVMTERDRFSTFALEADTASYALARRYLVNGRRPAPGLIRMEEFVNAFDYAYPAQSTRTFAIHAEAGPAPFGRDLTLLKVGVKAKVLGRDGRKPAHLVFVLDTSGSMGREDRLPLVRFALGLMVTQLDPRDRLSLVTFDSQARLILEAVPAARATDIQAAVAALATSATTNLLAGVELGYQIAARHFRSGETNRVLLCTDGVANVGPADAEAVLAKVGQYRRQGITLTSVGVGSGSYDDRMLEQLANRGDGNYVFVDSPEQARRVFVDDFAGTLQMVARNAKIQVEFSPARVRRYRLIGYENRDVADKDFRNDAVDAGEIGSGQAATALYELELLPLAEVATLPADMGTVYVRYENVDTGRVEEISTRLSDVLLRERSPERDPRFLLAACAAEFAEVLRESEHARDGSLETLESLATRVANALPLDQRSQELLTLVRRAQGLPR